MLINKSALLYSKNIEQGTFIVVGELKVFIIKLD